MKLENSVPKNLWRVQEVAEINKSMDPKNAVLYRIQNNSLGGRNASEEIATLYQMSCFLSAKNISKISTSTSPYWNSNFTLNQQLPS